MIALTPPAPEISQEAARQMLAIADKIEATWEKPTDDALDGSNKARRVAYEAVRLLRFAAATRAEGGGP